MASFDLTDILHRAVENGDAFRVSNRTETAQDEQYIVHFSPANQTLRLASPSVETEAVTDVDVWENADPGGNTTGGLFVHNMNYGVSAGEETPDATVTLVTNGGLNTTPGDQTEETQITADQPWQTPGDEAARGIWRKVPPGENISIVLTDRSTGAGNRFSFDTVLYEGDTFRHG